MLWTGRLELLQSSPWGDIQGLSPSRGSLSRATLGAVDVRHRSNASIPSALKEAAASLCPNVEMRLLDGHDLNLGALARTASDAFSAWSTVYKKPLDSPHRSDGIRLPVVASDWNGYRDTVVEGRTGFRVPTQSFEPGWNDLQLEQLARNDSSLDRVSARISGQIGVDAVAAGAALARLAKSPEMAVAMGCLGERRVQENYDWSVVLHRYSELLDDLLERREQT